MGANSGLVQGTANGLQQMLEMQGFAWQGKHVWIDGGNFYTDAITSTLGPYLVTSLTISTAQSKIIPGATSLSLRNNADSTNNVLIADAGQVTIRDTLTVSGGVTTGGSHVVSSGAIVPVQSVIAVNFVSTTSVTTAGTTGSYRDYYSAPVFSGAGSMDTHSGFYAFPEFSGSGTLQHFIGSVGRANISGVGTVASDMIGIYGGLTFGGIATIARADGVHAFVPTITANAVVTTYTGVSADVGDISAMTVTNAYGFSTLLPAGATGNNIGLVLTANGLAPTNTGKGLIYGAQTNTDPPAAVNSVSWNPTYALTTNNTFVLTGVATTVASTATAFNYATLQGAVSTVNIAGTGTITTVYGQSNLVNVNTGVVNGLITTFIGTLSRAVTFGTGTITTAIGVDGQVLLRVSGGANDPNITTAIAFRATIQNLGTNATLGVITTAYGFNAAAPAWGTTGTITNISGLFIANQGNALVTGSSWGIQIAAQSAATTKSWAIQTLGGFVAHTPTVSIASAAGSVWAGFNIPTSTATLTGSTGVTTAGGFNLVTIAAPAISSASANVTNAGTFVVVGAPTISGGATLTNAYALWVQGGLSRYDAPVLQGHTPTAINSTATATAAQVATGYITSTSAAPTTITLPTGTLLGAALGATQGTVHYLTIDNTAGASTVTIAVAVNGILSALAVAEGAGSGLLTVPSGITGQGTYQLVFSSATAYTFSRIA